MARKSHFMRFSNKLALGVKRALGILLAFEKMEDQAR
jgi:hypothetical protein